MKKKRKASNILSAEQLSLILNISEFTLKKLAKEKEIPCTYVNRRPQFNIDVILNHITNFPDTIKALRGIDFENTQPNRRNGFNLIKRESKKYGILYYARFSHNGKILPTTFNTHTNKIEEAELFAIENKSRLVEGYLARKDGRMFTMLEGFYGKKQNHISDRCGKEYRQMIISKFIPFLIAL